MPAKGRQTFLKSRPKDMPYAVLVFTTHTKREKRRRFQYVYQKDDIARQFRLHGRKGVTVSLYRLACYPAVVIKFIK